MNKKMDIPKSYKLLNKNLSARGQLPPCELLAREAPEAPQTIKAIATAVGCMPELDNTQLLKIPHGHVLTEVMEKLS